MDRRSQVVRLCEFHPALIEQDAQQSDAPLCSPAFSLLVATSRTQTRSHSVCRGCSLLYSYHVTAAAAKTELRAEQWLRPGRQPPHISGAAADAGTAAPHSGGAAAEGPGREPPNSGRAAAEAGTAAPHSGGAVAEAGTVAADSGGAVAEAGTASGCNGDKAVSRSILHIDSFSDIC